MRFGLANVPLWAFPRHDKGWERLRAQPLYQAIGHFTNNCIDSRYDTAWRGRVRYVLDKLEEDGKVYTLTLVDRNQALARLVGNTPDPSDDAIRLATLRGIKGLMVGSMDNLLSPAEVTAEALRVAMELIKTCEGARFMVFNGAEGKDSVESHHFSWDLGTEESRRLADDFELRLYASDEHVITADFRHRYWHRGQGGQVLRHYHRTLPLDRCIGEGTIYSEVGAHANLLEPLKDDVYWMERMYSAFSRHASEYYVHGFSVNAAEESPEYAWSRDTLHLLRYPIERAEYYGWIGSFGAEEWLIKTAAAAEARVQ